MPFKFIMAPKKCYGFSDWIMEIWEYDEAEVDIVAVVESAGTKALLKVIIETS